MDVNLRCVASRDTVRWNTKAELFQLHKSGILSTGFPQSCLGNKATNVIIIFRFSHFTEIDDDEKDTRFTPAVVEKFGNSMQQSIGDQTKGGSDEIYLLPLKVKRFSIYIFDPLGVKGSVYTFDP